MRAHAHTHTLSQHALTEFTPSGTRSWLPHHTFLSCHPATKDKAVKASYQDGFLLLLEGLLSGLQLFFGQDLGCPFDPLKLLGADD